MLRLPSFSLEVPDTLERATALMATAGARLISGGTDLLPNLKHRLDAPKLLVSTSRLTDLKSITKDENHLTIGAGVTLSQLAADSQVRRYASSLADAAGQVASPLIRNSATLGGNVNLDTRCRYVNQSEFWRGALGGCLKSAGDVCHVVPGAKSCVAALSADCVPVLLSLDAVLLQVSVRGTRTVPIGEYYSRDGIRHLNAPRDEITAGVRIPLYVPIGTGGRLLAYAKWSVRKAVDFPLISVAMRFDTEGADLIVRDARMVVGVLAAQPKVIRTQSLIGARLGSPSFDAEFTRLLGRQAKPLANVPTDPNYRRKILPIVALREFHRQLERRFVVNI